jgi:molybdate/tungstate transport system substrate-binding protein
MPRSRGGVRGFSRAARPRYLAALAAILMTLAGAVWALAGCTESQVTTSNPGAGGGKVTIRVLFAGSLIIPFAQLEKEFEATHPNIDVNMEGHGSIQAIRIVSDIHEQADLVVTADYRLIPMLLYQSKDPDTGLPYATWSIIFATNKMALAYTDKSQFASEVDSSNWFDVVNRPGVRLGLSDPRFDANGYRVLMTVKLAESYYNRAGLFASTFGDVFRVPIRAADARGSSTISVPEVLETKSGSHIVLRPYSVNLLPLLSTGDIDYAFEYESVIKQHGLEYVPLPPQINLGDPAYAADYARVSVKLDFQRFASVKPEFAGEPIRYGVTIPSNAQHPEAAAQLLAFLLGPEGQSIMAQNYQPMITPAPTDDLADLPEAVKAYCVSGN